MAYDSNKEVCDVIETKLNSVQTELSNRFEDLTEKVNNLVAYSEQEPETAMVVEDTQPSEQMINRKQVTVESIASMTAAIVSEEKEREKQKLNLIVHNFPESTTEASIQKNEDTQNVTSLINKYVGVDAHVSNATWIGKQTGGPRLMKVTLLTREEKLKILRNRFNLRSKEHPTHH